MTNTSFNLKANSYIVTQMTQTSHYIQTTQRTITYRFEPLEIHRLSMKLGAMTN
jgi:hypothetical protein